jgi:putative addiction module component (TIGR02574 family)
MHLTEIPQLQGATPAQKIELIDELWASIQPDAVSTPDSHLKELENRLSRVKESPEKALTPEEARARIRARTGL